MRAIDYVRKGAVLDIELFDLSAKGQVSGSTSQPYQVTLQLPVDPEPAQFLSTCSCPAFSKINGHCKHVAAVLIAIRDRYRIKPTQNHGGQSIHSMNDALKMPSLPHFGHTSNPPAPIGSYHLHLGRKAKRRPSKEDQREDYSPALSYAPRSTLSGIEAWLPVDFASAKNLPKHVEFRMQVKLNSLLVSVIDADGRGSFSPTALLQAQATNPNTDREVLRILARHEAEPSRRVVVQLSNKDKDKDKSKEKETRLFIEVRGEDATDLLFHLRGQRVLLEPHLLELKYSDEPLKPHFDVELNQDATMVFVKVSFQRVGDSRKYLVSHGGWFEGTPGYHVDTQDGVIRPLDKRVSPSILHRLMYHPYITESVDKLPMLVAQGLPRVAMEVGADLPELSQVADVVDIAPRFYMRAGGTLTEAQVRLKASYNDLEIDVRADGMTSPIIVSAPAPGQKRARCIRCDIVAQQAASATLQALGLAPDNDGSGFVVRGDKALEFWTNGISNLPEDWDMYVPDDLVDVQVRDQVLSANARVSSGVDWLSLRLTFESEGISVTQEELAKCLAEGRKYVRLSDGSFAKLDIEKVKAVLLRQAEILATGGGVGSKLPLSQAGRVQDLLEQVGKANVAEATKELFRKLKNIDQIKAAKKPRNLKAELRPYQEQGFQWLSFLHEIGSGGVLADDMGLGKTLQTIALLLSVKAMDQKTNETPFKALIVAPTSVVTNWLREMDKFAPSLRYALWHGSERKEREDDLEKADVIVTSYALLRRDEELLSNLSLRYVILDEAQHIKNPHSATAKAAKRLKASRRLALSGTPIENRLSEIWSIFDFVSHGLLGSLEKFEARYGRPIDSGDTKAAERLRNTIHPFILRRIKSEVAKDLPEKIETDQLCELPQEQATLYAAVLKEVRAQVMGEVEKNGLSRSHMQILAGLTRLRQAACDPRLLHLPKSFSDEDSGKLVALRDLVQISVAGRHRVLIFSQFVSMLQIIKRVMEEDKVSYEYLDGATKDRHAKVENFQREDGPSVFLISLKAGGSGLNLTAADTVIHFDPWWNPAVEDQATDRAHRIGQTKVVTTYRLIARGTIEEKILELGEKKRELVGAVLAEDAGGSKKLTKRDLEDLFEGGI